MHTEEAQIAFLVGVLVGVACAPFFEELAVGGIAVVEETCPSQWGQAFVDLDDPRFVERTRIEGKIKAIVHLHLHLRMRCTQPRSSLCTICVSKDSNGKT